MASDHDKENFIALLNGLFEDVEKEAQERHKMGSQQYGSLKFLENDTLEMALEEILDLINYARYTAVKIKLLQITIAQQAADVLPTEPQGASFIETRQFLGKGFEK